MVTCLIGMSLYFANQAWINQGLVDIDQVPTVQAAHRIDINTAKWPEIVVLPGLGEKLARAIVAHRETIGPFDSLDAIQSVPGIGEKKLNQLRPYLLPIANE